MCTQVTASMRFDVISIHKWQVSFWGLKYKTSLSYMQPPGVRMTFVRLYPLFRLLHSITIK